MQLDPEGGFLNISRAKRFVKFDSDWKDWENVALNIPKLLKDRQLRSIIDGELPEVSFKRLMNPSIEMIERIYTMFSFLAHAYIRGTEGDELIKKLPKKIAQVWVDAAEALDLPPVSTYASTVLFNWTFENSPKELVDLKIRFTSTGLIDEEWFYLVSAGIDLRSPRVLDIVERITRDKIDAALADLTSVIKELTTVLNRMYEKCQPEAFYNQIRRYFAGWLNDQDLGENGLEYELEEGNRFFKLAGGSAAQTATIKLIDIILSVDHEGGKEGTFQHGTKRISYLREMRSYMPKSHREYLVWAEQVFASADLRSKIEQSSSFKPCLEALIEFRNAHIIMVSRYIINPSAKTHQKALGTGGSNPLPFLKQIRDDTSNKLH